MIILNNFNNIYFQKRTKAKNEDNKKDKPLDTIKTIQQQNSEIAADFAAALIMPKINFVTGLFSKKSPETKNTQTNAKN